MSESDPNRDYKYLDVDKIREGPLDPVDDPCDIVLENALLDIVQLAEESGMEGDDVDRVLRKIIDDRTQRLRNRFTLHLGEKEDTKE